MCRSYDPRVAKKCREDDAEEVRAKEQANFCDYFRPRSGAFDSALASAEQRAKDQLAALFGTDATAPTGGQPGGPDALFGGGDKRRQ